MYSHLEDIHLCTLGKHTFVYVWKKNICVRLKGGSRCATRAFATPIFVASATPIFVASATPYFRISATQTAATPKILF